MLLLELAHVDDGHVLLAAIQQIGERQRRLGLAGAGRADHQEHADRLARIGQPGARLVWIACATASSACGWPTMRCLHRLLADAARCGSRSTACGRSGCRSSPRRPRRSPGDRPPGRSAASRPAGRAASPMCRRASRAAHPCPRCSRDPRSCARVSAISAARRFSCSQRASSSASSCASFARSRQQVLAPRLMRSPAAISRSRMPTSVSISAMRRWRSSIGGGTAAWLIADARAGGVDQADRLVGQLARRDVARRQPHRLAHRLVEDADVVMLLQRRRPGRAPSRSPSAPAAPRPSPPGSAGSAPRPSRSISCIPPRWSPRWCAARRAPAPASAGWRRRPVRPHRRRRSACAPRR